MKFKSISSGDVLTQLFLKKAESVSPILELIECYSMVGNSDTPRKSSAATMGSTRALDNDYSANIVTPQFASATLKIVGDRIQTDKAHERRGADIASVRALDLVTAGISFGKHMNDQLINGDGLSNNQTGIKTLCVSGQKIYAKSSSAALVIGTGWSDSVQSIWQQWKEKLHELTGMVTSGGEINLIMDSALIARLSNVAGTEITITKNEFGQLITKWNNIRLVPSGQKKDGSKVIAGDETHGTIVGGCHSIYAVAFGEGTDLTHATNRGFLVDDLGLVANFYEYSAEADLAAVLIDNKAIAKLEGIQLA